MLPADPKATSERKRLPKGSGFPKEKQPLLPNVCVQARGVISESASKRYLFHIIYPFPWEIVECATGSM